ncbi:sigma-54 interaction domain-containing protein [Bacillus kexueae]|uniref:sigma-54 interaction domain-containing protein n=1 Tax=Aeribacillus kexueae TaxID=2078952 RepID=UPI001FB04347|nr:sigma 54-interacting transcriptional regulator [Bacillus kexueae]
MNIGMKWVKVLKDYLEETEAILNAIKEDFMVTSTDGTIIRATKVTADIYGMKEDELIGQSVYDLERRGIFTPLVTPLVLDKRDRVTVVQQTLTGKKLLITGIPVFDDEGEIYRIVSFSYDLTELLNMKKYLEKMQDEMDRVKLELENLKSERVGEDGFIAQDPVMKRSVQIARRVADVDVNVLLLGESGVGKTMFAKDIHKRSSRSEGPFIEVNCGAIPASLFEAEFFGYEGGAFSGAKRQGKPGLAELADGGTLFLDEVGELSLEHQVKLLSLIQNKKFYRVGGTKERTVDFRLIAATNQDLRRLVDEGKFREDLYFRLHVVPITIPPLRERTGDLVPLIHYFLQYFNEKYNRKRELDEGVLYQLLQNPWKGNVRELMNVMERLVVTSPTKLITIDYLPEAMRMDMPQVMPEVSYTEKTLDEVLSEVEYNVLKEAKERYGTTTKIAEKLGISQPTAVRKLKKYNL